MEKKNARALEYYKFANFFFANLYKDYIMIYYI